MARRNQRANDGSEAKAKLIEMKKKHAKDKLKKSDWEELEKLYDEWFDDMNGEQRK